MQRYSITHHPHNYSLRAPDDYVALVASAMVANGTGLHRGEWVIEPGGHFWAARDRLGEEYGAIVRRVTVTRLDELLTALRSVMIDGEVWDEDVRGFGSTMSAIETLAAVAERRHYQFETISPDLRVWSLRTANRLEADGLVRPTTYIL
jgi:hypothetical protein